MPVAITGLKIYAKVAITLPLSLLSLSVTVPRIMLWHDCNRSADHGEIIISLFFNLKAMKIWRQYAESLSQWFLAFLML